MSDGPSAAVVRRLAPALVAALAAIALRVADPAPLVALDDAALDAFVRQTPPPAPSPDVVVVAVDESSLAAYGQWPWRRDVLARLVVALREAGAAAIAFDILFPEADRLGQANGDAGATSTDAALADAMRTAPVVTGMALTFDGTGDARPSSCVTSPLPLVVRHGEDRDPVATLFRATGAVCSVPVLGAAARASGTINASPDADGVLRRLPVLTRLGGQVHPTLALAAVAVAHPQPLVVEARADGGLDVVLDQARLALDTQGHALLRPRGRGRAYPHLSAAAVLDGRLAGDAVRGRVVFVGATALGVRDTVATALDPRFPGVELHATLADTLLGGATAWRPAAARLVEVGGAAAGALLAALAVTLLGVAGGSAVAVAGAAGTWLALRAWFAAAGALVSPASALVGLGLGAITAAAAELVAARHRAASEHRRREQAQRLIVQTLTSLTETRDLETGRHARRTQEYTRLLATTLVAAGRQRGYLTPHRIDLIATLAPLHDIGKVGISDAVLHKPGQLTASEYREMQTHTSLGHETLRKAEALANVHDDEVLTLAKDIVFTHHERWDGSGYPRGLVGDAIPLPGRLVAVVDTYDALVAERPYKAALPHDEALEIIRRGRGTHFDPDVVDAFIACHDQLRRLEHAGGAGLPASRA